MTETTNIGEAYGFFDSSASKAVIQVELPTILQRVGSPKELEVSLMELRDLEKIKVDSDLLQLIKESEIYPIFPSKYKDQMKTAKPVKMTDLKYALKATCLGRGNEETAKELEQIINGIYKKYDDGKPFNVAVVFKVDGEYFFSE